MPALSGGGCPVTPWLGDHRFPRWRGCRQRKGPSLVGKGPSGTAKTPPARGGDQREAGRLPVEVGQSVLERRVRMVVMAVEGRRGPMELCRLNRDPVGRRFGYLRTPVVTHSKNFI